MDGSLGTPAESVAGLEIAAGMISLRVPFFKGSLREARRWAERTLEASYRAVPQPVELQIAAMASIAWICLCQGLPDEAERMLERSIIACGADVADLAALRADPTLDPNLPAPVEFAIGSALMLVHSDVRALRILARAREKFTATGDSGGAAMAELFEALTAAFLGTAEEALQITRRHLDNATSAGAEWAKSWAEIAWIIAQTKYGDPERTVEVGRGVLTRQVAMRDHWGAVWTLHARTWTLARLLADEPKAASARSNARAVQIARLLGGAAALRAELGVDITYLSPFAAETEQAVKITRRMLGGKAFEAAWREGAGLRPVLDGVTRLALGTLSSDKLPAGYPGARRQATPWPQLSEAEQEVAVLAAAGWPNTAIAARRGSSHRTVDAQVAAILKKLMITSRAEILALVPADRRDRIAREQRHRPRGPQRHGA
jgi:DNA-binding CsgD family transcriptional regulator